MTHPPAPLRPVSDEHRHADYAPRSQVIAALRKAKAPDELIAWAANVLPDAEAHLRTPAGEAVNQWFAEWQASESKHWGDKIAWSTAFTIAARIDALAKGGRS